MLRSTSNVAPLSGTNSSVAEDVRPWPLVSLVIPAKNEARNPVTILRNVPERVGEIILVDGARPMSPGS